MDSQGQFRSSLHGFHRQDVLQYIDELQNEAAQKENYLNSSLERQAARATAAEAERDALQETITQLREEIAQRDTQLQEMERLRKQAATAVALREDLAQAQAKLEAARQNENAVAQLASARQYGKQLSDRIAALEQENAQLRETIQSIRDRIQSVHTNGQNFVSEALRCSDACLTALEEEISSLEEKLGETRRRIGEERTSVARQGDVTGIRLHELISLLRVDDTAMPSATSEDVSEAHRFFEETPASAPAPQSSSHERDTVHVRRVTPSSEGKVKKWIDGWLPRDT